MLIQPDANQKSRTYMEFETSTAAVVGELRILSPGSSAFKPAHDLVRRPYMVLVGPIDYRYGDENGA